MERVFIKFYKTTEGGRYQIVLYIFDGHQVLRLFSSVVEVLAPDAVKVCLYHSLHLIHFLLFFCNYKSNYTLIWNRKR